MNKSIQRYICQNINLISKILIVYIIGVIIGVVILNFGSIKQEYIDIVRNILDDTKNSNFEGINIITNAIKNNVIYISFIYLSLFTLIAPIFVFFWIIVKAIVTGIYIGVIISILGTFKGILAVMLSVILPFIISILGYTIICTNVINLFNNLRIGNKLGIKEMIREIYWAIIAISLISFAIVIEQVTVGIIIKVYTGG